MNKQIILRQRPKPSFWGILTYIVFIIIFILKYLKPLIPSKKTIWISSIRSKRQIAKWIINNDYRSRSIIEFSGNVSGEASLIVKESNKLTNKIILQRGENYFTFAVFDEGLYTFHIEVVGEVYNCSLKLNNSLKV